LKTGVVADAAQNSNSFLHDNLKPKKHFKNPKGQISLNATEAITRSTSTQNKI